MAWTRLEDKLVMDLLSLRTGTANHFAASVAYRTLQADSVADASVGVANHVWCQGMPAHLAESVLWAAILGTNQRKLFSEAPVLQQSAATGPTQAPQQFRLNPKYAGANAGRRSHSRTENTSRGSAGPANATYVKYLQTAIAA